MRKLKEVLEHGSIPMLKARRGSLVAYRGTLEHESERDERIDVQGDIYRIDERIDELQVDKIR